VPLPKPAAGTADGGGARQALGQAMHSVPFLVMSGAYFVCGMQLVFLTTHLPAYLAICGMDPMLGAQVLGLIGAFNVLGSLFFGWAGGRWNKQLLLGLIYTARSLVLAGYFIAPPTPTSTLVFAAIMGFLWLGVAPLVSGSVAEMFGLRWQAMVQGVAFFSHQMGSFIGAFGGGLLYTALGNYELAWRLGVAIGLVAGAVQIGVALGGRPPGRGRLVPA
jgi:MFS family permease